MNASGKNGAMTVWQKAALTCLDHAARRDAVKGGNGCRTTVDVAEHVGITTEQARRVLYSLEDDWVDLYDATPLEWRITDAGRAALEASK